MSQGRVRVIRARPALEKKTVMNTDTTDAPSRRVVLRDSDLRALKPILQAGVGVRVPLRQNLRRFLTDDLGIDPAYVDERLQTVFLDGSPVDDFDTAVVMPGATLALSGAMPGLVGATMRRGGYYARMREGIAYDSGAEQGEVDAPSEKPVVYVKLFNRVLDDLARDLAVGQPLLVEGRWLKDLPASEGVEAGEPDAVWLTLTFAD